jgi:hypothetical protein
VLLRGILDRHEVIADAAHKSKRAHGRCCICQQAALEVGIRPGLCHHLGAVVRADACFIGLDDRVERRRIDVALFGQDGLERAHARLRFCKL